MQSENGTSSLPAPPKPAVNRSIETLENDDDVMENPIKRSRVENISETISELNVKLKYPEHFGFYLTTVHGITQEFNENGAVGLTDILSPKIGPLVASAQFTFLIDINWLISQYPEEFRDKPLLVVHGEISQSRIDNLEKEASKLTTVTHLKAKMKIIFGVHHTKLILLHYEDGMRVVILTANLIEKDWQKKTQGVWISPKFPQMKDNCRSSTAGDSTTNFKKDLLEYLYCYNAHPVEEWCDIIKKHDFSEAKVFLIASIPGRHTGEKKSAFGHLKLRRVLNEHGLSDTMVSSDWPVIGQFSSIGSLGANSEKWLCNEFLKSLSATKNKVLTTGFPKLNLIFPSLENIRLGLDGYLAGESVSYNRNNAYRQQWLNMFLNQWKSEKLGRSGACPHIKSYCRISPDSHSLSWFLLTSANLSKAAWGVLEKAETQIMIRSYELGVLFLPQYFNLETYFNVRMSVNEKTDFPIPYDLPLTPYEESDEPWVWDVPRNNVPDCHGEFYKPPNYI